METITAVIDSKNRS